MTSLILAHAGPGTVGAAILTFLFGVAFGTSLGADQ